MAYPARVSDLDYITFLLAAQTAFSCVEAAACDPNNDGEPDDPAAHDCYTRLLLRQPPDPEALWQETQPLVDTNTGLLVVDDSTLDKPYARQMALVHKHWSGKHHRVVWGINLVTLLWTDGGAKLPVDFRLSNGPQDGLSKHQHFRAMLEAAKQRGFAPRYVCMDSWYATVDNLKAIRANNWRFVAGLKSNRRVSTEKGHSCAVYELNIPADGLVVHLRGYGQVRVFTRTNADMEEARFWATNDLTMTGAQHAALCRQALAIEEYHRGLKQCCGVERCQARKERAQRNHILYALRAFVRLEQQRLDTGRSWYESKKQVVRDALKAFRAKRTCMAATTA